MFRSGVVVIMIPLFAFALLSTGYVQNFLARKAAKYLSQELNTEVSVGGVSLNIFLDIVLKDLKVADRHGKPLLDIEEINIDFHKFSLKRRFLSLESITVDKPLIIMKQYPGDTVMNYAFIIDYFSKPVKDTVAPPAWTIALKDFSLKNASFSYIIPDSANQNQSVSFKRLMMSGINLELRDLAIETDTISGYLKNLSLIENQNLHLKKLSGVFSVSPRFIKTKDLRILLNESFAHLDVSADFEAYKAFDDFIHQVHLSGRIHESAISANLLNRFMPYQANSEEMIFFKAAFNGKIDNLKIKDMELDAGDALYYKGALSMVGLPDIKETFMHFNIKEMKASVAGLESLNLRMKNGNPVFVIPAFVRRLEN